MGKIRTVCVYCGSGPGSDPAFVVAAQGFGKILAENQIRLVYGGGSIGLMGALASSVIEYGGDVTGIIPEFLIGREQPRKLAQDMVVTRDMHERKRTMFERADAFVALPGGIGTLEELVEQMTWAQLGRHKKPILVANIKGFWNPFCDMLEHMQRMAFLHDENRLNFLVAERVEDILPKLIASADAVPEAEKAMAEPAAGRM